MQLVQLFNRASPSIVAATILAFGGLIWSMNNQLTQINGTLRNLSDVIIRISSRVDTLEAAQQSAELEIRELRVMMRAGGSGR